MCIFARSPDGGTVLFHYYLLGGDTAAPSGLYARLCHAFLALFLFKNKSLETNYLRIYWTGFQDFLTVW